MYYFNRSDDQGPSMDPLKNVGGRVTAIMNGRDSGWVSSLLNLCGETVFDDTGMDAGNG